MLLAFYGDDFTGSTDVMESLAYGGIETVLFVKPPTDTLLRRYAHVQAVGIAGNSRAMTPDQMDDKLPVAFETLGRLEPAIVHYKVCSTFDSSPNVGSIGRAIELGQRVFRNRCCPLVVGAPVLQRFCVFGNLFARSGLDSAPYRLDRHPTMKCHPVTPMDESDLRVHLSRQTDRPVRLIDVLSLNSEASDWQQLGADEQDGIVLFDTLTDDHLVTIGGILWKMRQQESGPMFVAGSSGVEYALTAHWKASGLVPTEFHWTAVGEPRPQTLVLSGSCSPVTDRQIEWAIRNGFAEVAVDTTQAHDTNARQREIDRVVDATVPLLQQGRSVVVHTCRGPSDVRIERTRASAAELGTMLGRALHGTLSRHRLARVAVTGGDTSGHVARHVDIEALEVVGPLAPGSPLCVASSRNKAVDGLEITFKGGQVGHDDFFKTVLNGKP